MRLYNKLISCGVSNLVLHWFKSYFSRTQEVEVGNTISQSKAIQTGIGQGTILGPLIFIFYIYDVINNVGNLRVNMYADGCLIYKIGNNWENMVPEIQAGLDGFQSWCKNNCLKLNICKLKSLIIGTQHKMLSLVGDNRITLDDEILNVWV